MHYDPKAIEVLLEKEEDRMNREFQNCHDNSVKRDLGRQLGEIKAARYRVRDQMYGFCENCCIAIPWRELCARPERRTCDGCETAATPNARTG